MTMISITYVIKIMKTSSHLVKPFLKNAPNVAILSNPNDVVEENGPKGVTTTYDVSIPPGQCCYVMVILITDTLH